jgi:very-short-patch-repair endonuclease
MVYIFLIVLIVVLVIVFEFLFGRRISGLKYQYTKKEYLMTQSERECFYVLHKIIGDTYYIFPQIHLSSFLEHKIKGQSWFGAFKHINEKSVDFILCDKQNLSIRLAIELDDKSHELETRKERDREVERILKSAGMPLLRITKSDYQEENSLLHKIKTIDIV